MRSQPPEMYGFAPFRTLKQCILGAVRLLTDTLVGTENCLEGD